MDLVLNLIFLNFPVANNPKYICSRPLGMSFDTISENIIVLDTTDGVFELNIKNGEKKQFVSDQTVIGSTVRLNTIVNHITPNINFTGSSPCQILQLRGSAEIFISPTHHLITV